MKRTTERKWHSWLNGVALTICPSMWRRQRRLCWTSGGGTPLTTPHWPSTARLCRESSALNSWGCTSRRISPGPPTPCHSPRRHNSAYTFSASWKSKSPTTHPHHILQGTMRVCWPAASLSGTGTAVLLTCKDPPADSEHGCKDNRCPSPIHPGHFLAWCSSKTNSIVKEPHPPLHSLFQLLPSGRRYRSIRARSARLLNSFFPQAVRALNPNHPAPPLKNPMQTLPPETWSTRCALELCALDTFFHTAVCTQSHKRLSNYVC